MDRVQMIESYGAAYEELELALRELPGEMWGYRSPHDPWTVHEIVIHITDSEANSYVRCRRAIAEPGESVMAYDENGWAQSLRYSEQSTDDALDLFRALRRNTYNLVKDLPEETWANTIYHPENGTMTLDDWLGVYERHVHDHVNQMREIYREWLAVKRDA
jgi:hypothetical protein